MIELRKHKKTMSAGGAIFAAALGLSAVSSGAGAADWSTTFLSINQAEYLDNFVNDEVNAAIRDDDFRLSTNTRVYSRGRFEDGVSVTIGGRLLYFQHIDRTDQDSLGVGGFADVAKQFGDITARLGYFGNYRRRDGADLFVENGGTLALSYNPSRAYTLSAFGRIGYRDFDDANFVGLDQLRYDGTLRAFWYPFQDSTYLSLAGSVARADADVEFQSTTTYSVDVRASHHVTERTALSARFRYSRKDFDEGNPAIQGGLTREDETLQAFGRLDYDFSRNVRAFAEAGVVDQSSNINNQSFTGPRASVGVRLLFSTGR